MNSLQIGMYLVGNGTHFTWSAQDVAEFNWAITTLNAMSEFGNLGTASHPFYAIATGELTDFSLARKKWLSAKRRSST